jgi:hypothetical protein
LAESGKLRGFGGRAPKGACQWQAAGARGRDEKKQLTHRFPAGFVRSILSDFNRGALGAAEAGERLGVGRTRLYQLRAAWLRDRAGFEPGASGGGRGGTWPAGVVALLREFLPLQSPPNFQLVADEMERLHGFRRARSTVEAYVKKHLPHLVARAAPRPRVHRRFRRACAGELWQHDSSVHQWWPAPAKQTLLLTVDDCSGFCVAGRFVERDTTWDHFEHFREGFGRHGLPEAVYTDGLSLFGPSSSHDHSDPRSEFQRALRALGVAHLVAPTPQAKGKIERRFGTFQKRLVTLMAHERVADWRHADELLQMEIRRQNGKRLRSTGKVPAEVWEEQLLRRTARLRTAPAPSLLDLHLSLRTTRRVHLGHIIQFDGQDYEISPTQRKTVTVLFHPAKQFWVLDHPPKFTWPPVLGHFTL